MDNIKRIKKTISVYDLKDLLKSISALMLIPENTNRIIRLEYLINIIASIEYSSNKPFISINRLKNICNDSSCLEDVIRLEDPCENAFTESLTFFEGSYIVFPGLTENPTFVLKHLLKSIFLYKGSIGNPEFKRKVRQYVQFILFLSNTVANKANIDRNHIETKLMDKVLIPPKKELNKFKEAVTFSLKELEKICSKVHLELDEIENMITEFGSINLDAQQYDTLNNVLNSKPLIRIGDEVIISDIGALLSVARHKIITLSIDYDCTLEVAKVFKMACWETLVNRLALLRIYPIMKDFNYFENEFYKEHFFSLDLDKIMLVQFICDDLSNYDKNQIYGNYDNKEINSLLKERIEILNQKFKKNINGPSDALTLVIASGVNRIMGFGIISSFLDGNILSFSVSDLEYFCRDEKGNDLILWKYSRELERISSDTELLKFNELDAYEIFKSNNCSFYLSDDKKPTHIYFGAGEGASLRKRVIKKMDIHGVKSFTEGMIIEVRNKEEIDIPLFEPVLNTTDKMGTYIECYKIPIWVIFDITDINKKIYLYSNLIIDLISYWLFELESILKIFFEPFSKENVLNIEIKFISNEEEEGKKELEELKLHEIIDINTYEKGEYVYFNLKMKEQITRIFYGADNTGEKKFMSFIIENLNLYIKNKWKVDLLKDNDSFNKKIIELFSPEAKKKIILMDSSKNPMLEDIVGVKNRLIDPIDNNSILDEIGEHLIEKFDLVVGKIGKKERNTIVKEAVSYLYNKLESEISYLSNENLFEHILAHNEELIVRFEQFRLTMPTRFYCYHLPDYEEETKKTNLNIQSTSLANRFLLEYISAKPPKGKKKITFEIYEKLIALCNEIINIGFQSDLINYRLFDFDFKILESGRIGIERRAFEALKERYLKDYTFSEIERSKEAFSSFGKSNNSNDIEQVDNDLDNAYENAFGFSLNEHSIFIGHIYNIGVEIETPYKVMERDILINKIKKITGWNSDKISIIINFLSSEKRDDYLCPPSPYKKEDVYPWRFNRRLSYLRKPMINYEGYIYWGNKNLMKSLVYISYLIVEGKLNTEHVELNKVLGKFLVAKGETFHKKVISLFKSLMDISVKKKVKKIGKLYIEENKKNLGDIDVLLIDRKKSKFYVIECKDMEFAKTPYELSIEVKNLFIGKKSLISKHNKRVKWVKENINTIIDHYNLDNSRKWKVKDFIVISKEMFSPYIYKSSANFETYQNLKYWKQNNKLIEYLSKKYK